MQAGGRTDGDPSGVQSAQLGSAAGMVTPQQQQSSCGGAAQIVTPHRFGLMHSISKNTLLYRANNHSIINFYNLCTKPMLIH